MGRRVEETLVWAAKKRAGATLSSEEKAREKELLPFANTDEEP